MIEGLAGFDFAAFHFIRPWFLVLGPAFALLWWIIRRDATKGPELPEAIAPHLAAALTIPAGERRRMMPIDGVALTLILMALAAAGPTWSRVPNPLLADTAPVVVVLKVTPSMDQTDVPPSRLERAKLKIRDLVSARAGAKTALVAYAGTAHQVVPPTEDADVLLPFLEGLETRVMPQEGERATVALELAQQVLDSQEAPGSILYMLDRVTDADLPRFREHLKADGAPLLFWTVGADMSTTSNLAGLSASAPVEITADGSDVKQITAAVESAYRAALSGDERQKWEDRGWLLLLPAVLIALFWFRKGWTMQWSFLLLCCALLLPSGKAHAEGWRDWFLTADQQGRLAFESKDYEAAAGLFEDPLWKAYSLYRLGRYEEAAELYAWQPSAEAALGEGMALMRSRGYRAAVAAFEKAVERDPNNEAARHNLALSKFILDYVETTREQSDTGEESGIGADDVIYDNEAGRGTESRRPSAPTGDSAPQTAEQWMRTVDTQTGDFLRSRFALEAARSAQ